MTWFPFATPDDAVMFAWFTDLFRRESAHTRRVRQGGPRQRRVTVVAPDDPVMAARAAAIIRHESGYAPYEYWPDEMRVAADEAADELAAWHKILHPDG